MKAVYKNTLTILAAACVVLICMMLVQTSYAHAGMSFDEKTDGVNSYSRAEGITLNDDNWFTIYPTEGTGDIMSYTKSGDTDCCWISVKTWSSRSADSYISVYGIKEGSCAITVQNVSNPSDEVTIPITVTSKVTEATLKNSSIIDHYYGLKMLELSTMKGADATLKVGDDVYTDFTREEYQDHDNLTFKLNKAYKIGTKIIPTITYNGLTVQAKTVKINSATSCWGFKSSKKKAKVLKVEVRNLHKGDVVKVKYKGKTYKSAKWKTDTSYETWKWVSVKLKKKMTSSAKFKVWVVNKYGQKLTLPSTYQLKNWKYEAMW